MGEIKYNDQDCRWYRKEENVWGLVREMRVDSLFDRLGTYHYEFVNIESEGVTFFRKCRFV